MDDLHLRFRFLGQFAVRAESSWTGGPSPKKGRDLIQYLGAYPRRVATCDQLAAAFWPGVDFDVVAHRIHLAASGARTYLRGLVAGQDIIERVPGGYAWSPRVSIASDADEFLRLCRVASIESLESATTLYCGEFLAGETADWLQPLRILCASAYGCAMDRLAEEAVATGDFAKALSYGLELSAAEPGHEGATRLVMRCFAALGQRARALERYAAFHHYLERHLGVGPTPQTVMLARELGAESDRRDF